MYCENLTGYLKLLFENGAVKLPSVSNETWRQKVYEKCIHQIGSKNYAENLPANIELITKTGIISHLAFELAKKAKSEFGLDVKSNDIYNVCRLVRPGDTAEGFRGHFDSHLFTLVTPIQIPDFANLDSTGQLHYFPLARQRPRSEIRNVLGKLAYKRFNSASGFDKLAAKTNKIIDDFADYQPLLFLGNTTFHGNSPIQSGVSENRMTILTHFFDPSPKYGIGQVMRMLRKR
ncbi:hypothetical protein N9E67_00735 [Amylibacter sp.]|nr:hypothetical protein [Amylibacter sp.]